MPLQFMSIDYTPLVSSRFYYRLVLQTVHEEIINASLSLEVVVQLTIGESFTTVFTSTLNFERFRRVLKIQGSYKQVIAPYVILESSEGRMFPVTRLSIAARERLTQF